MILKKNIFWINILGEGIDFEEGDLVDQLDVPSRPNGNIANIGYLLFLMWEFRVGGGRMSNCYCQLPFEGDFLPLGCSMSSEYDMSLILHLSYLCLGPKIIDDHMTVPEIKHKWEKENSDFKHYIEKECQ